MEIPTLIKNKDDGEDLKQLGFLWSGTLLFLACMSKLYEYLKQNSGSLKPTVVFLEGKIIAVVRPFYKENKRLYSLLLFADAQVDKVTVIIDKHGPNFVKKIMSIVQWATQTTEELCDKTRKGGIRSVTMHVGIKVALFVMTESMQLLVKLGHFPALPTFPGMPTSLPSLDLPTSLPSLDLKVTDPLTDPIKIGTDLAENVI
ncbi:rubber elongation factor protein [Tripterygium wilfordii]|uniref:Rubber elongation factor protein n=1 Tax=Tripterygium wilfordii TaxID=458696 RepID=A0A7J7BXX3_TRIWF|nr:REF/SRPP-like protein At1g67360 [Tripterygium wilfordii]KAF5726668.1 rubber elongation factor protein [Tripterygium wilfordii]